MSKKDPVKFDLHEVVNIVRDMCNLQVSGVDSAIPYLRGAPGGGKTESIRNMAHEDDDLFLSCHFALKQPEDLGGIPQFTNVKINGNDILSTKWSIPEILETLLHMSEEAEKRKKKVIFFLDDIHRCGPFHVTALFELLSERKIREIHIPQNVAMVLAGNGSIKAGAQLTNSAIINRCSIMDVQTNFDYWCEHYALKNNFNMHILSFLKNDRYRKWFHAEEDITDPWASPRAWSKLSNLLNIYLNGPNPISTQKIEYICQSHVGQEATNDFISYYQIISKFEVDKMFKKIGESLKKNSLQTVIDEIVNDIQKHDMLHIFALSQAILIGFTQVDEEARKNNDYFQIMCAFMFAFLKNPQNENPEINVSVFRELYQFILKSDQEKKMLQETYNQMAEELGEKSINDHITEFLKKLTSTKR